LSLHVNPLKIVQDRNGTLTISPEAMIIYAEGVPEFSYVREVIGNWESFTSRVVKLDAVATVTLQIGEEVKEKTGKCQAYIYGYVPGSSEWEEGSCVAVVTLDCPSITVEHADCYFLFVHFEFEDKIFDAKITIPIYEELAV